MPFRVGPAALIVALLAFALAAISFWRAAAVDDGPAVPAVAIELPEPSPGQAGGEPQGGDRQDADGGARASVASPAGSQGLRAEPGRSPTRTESGSGTGGGDLPDAAAGPPAGRQNRLTLDHPAGAHPLVWVRQGMQVEIHTEPGGGELVSRVGRRTEFGSPTVFGVVRRSGRWAAVTTPDLPNNRLGWIELDEGRLKSGWTKLSVEVDVSQRRAVLIEAGEPVRSFAVTVGMPGAETPTGRFAVTDTFRGGLNPAYGCCAVALSATQPNLPSGWLGGRRIAIHGTSGPLGIAASHGCVRAADADVSKLVDRLPLGTPVFIRS